MKLFAILSAMAVSTACFASPPSFCTRPDIHGDAIVFTCEGDLWLGSVKTGEANRITSAPGDETNAKFSPDGSLIAFTAHYDGGQDVYVMPLSGGAPRRLTYDPAGATVQGWTPDGKNVLFRSVRDYVYGPRPMLYAVPVTGGLPHRLPMPQVDFAAQRGDGLIAYVPTSREWANWFRYRAGQTDAIWTYRPDTRAFKQITRGKYVVTSPVWCASSIYAASERDGVSNIARINPVNGDEVPITHYAAVPARYPSSDGVRIVFEHGPGIALFDPTSKRVTELKLELHSDRIHTVRQRVPLAANIASFSPGPTGRRLAMEARGQIISIAVGDGEMRVLDSLAGSRSSLPAWSSDGKRIAFVSDRTGENEIWTVDSSGSASASQLTHGLKSNLYQPRWTPDDKHLIVADRAGRLLCIEVKSGDVKVIDTSVGLGEYDGYHPGFDISPDGKFIAFDHGGENYIQSVHIYEIASGKTAALSVEGINCYSPAFTTDGKYVAYLSDRALSPFLSVTQKIAFDKVGKVNLVALSKATPSPFLPRPEDEGAAPAKPTPAGASTAVDFSGLLDRIMDVPIRPGRYGGLTAVEGRLLMVDQAEPVGFNGPGGKQGTLVEFKFETKETSAVVSGIDGAVVTADRKKIMLIKGGGFSLIDSTAGAGARETPISIAQYSVTVDPVAEWKEVFAESWRAARDFYYDPGMHGVDWQAIYKKYAEQLPLVGSRTDLTRLQSDMIAELSTGHSFVGNPEAAISGPGYGFLGAEFESTPGQPGLMVTKILKGDPLDPSQRSPLSLPGVDVHVGDYLLAINGTPIDPNQDVLAALIGTAGQVVSLTLNRTSQSAGARTVYVRPLDLAGQSKLLYENWVEGRREYVAAHGGGNLGYVHLSNMMDAGAISFQKSQYNNLLKAGVIYDTRFNAGGFIAPILEETMAAHPLEWFHVRNGATWTAENWAPIGYRAAICNEYNFSDGELFCEVWKKMKIGPLIGHITGGGLVGSGGGYRLVDNGTISIPNYGGYADGKWLVEGKGASPDIAVEQDPEKVVAGSDPQLDKTIELLEKLIRENPPHKPEHPPFPVMPR
jgi:tricorn protease